MVAPRNVIGWLRRRVGAGITRLQRVHPAIDRAALAAHRLVYTRKFFRDGPRRVGTSDGLVFVVFNHCYDLDVDALCAAATPHTLWVLEPFLLFTDAHHFFAPEERDLECVYGTGSQRESIARIKAAFVTRLARRLVDEAHIDALIAPSDTFYYLRPLIEELHALGVPTIVQDKEGTIAPSPMMGEYARVLRERYPPISDLYLFWNDTVQEFWSGIGVAAERSRVIGQPRSDFFFHPERWPSKSSLGVRDGKQLLVAFTYDANAYIHSTDPRPWQSMRDELHAALRELARERPDVDVVVKAHPQQADLPGLVAEFAADPVPNLTLMSGAKTGSHLLVHADAIVGFQSTVMIEAMLTRKPVVYAGWGALHDQHRASLLPIPGSGAVSVPTDRADFARLMRAALDGELATTPEQQRARRLFADRYFFGADGSVAQRVLAAAAEVAARGPTG